ncbi:MAG: DNA-3-methyladenine glycosylase [Bacteroidetes bacterium]|nr:DNA-3-methyladenine glycosylase [Bacteroidota bacterium]
MQGVLQESYYCNEDVVFLAKDLLGKLITLKNADGFVSAIITETEAYAGVTDKASHAYGGRRTPRNEVMYGSGGMAYVFLCYGIHYLFNVVTGPKNTPHAVLIRGVIPVEGIDLMLARRKLNSIDNRGFNGPGKVTSALGINLSYNGASLTGSAIQIKEIGVAVSTSQIKVSKRIGVNYAEEDALLPYRFELLDKMTVKKNVLL